MGQEIEGEGYAVAYAVSEDNLRLGRIVVADSVTLSDAISRGFGVNVADAVTLSDSLAFDRLLALADSVVASDALAFDRGLVLSDGVTVGDLIDAVLGQAGIPVWQEIILCYCYNGRRMVQAVERANEVVTASVVSEVCPAVVAVQVPASVIMVEVL